MIITSFWVVTKPTSRSTVEDICFQADIYDLEKQFKGGLKAEDVVSIYTEKALAVVKAELLIHRAKINN